MSDSMHVFDRRAVRAHRNRAAPGFAAYDFLFRESADRLADRLLDIAREFPLAVDIGCHDGGLRNAVLASGRIGALLQSDLSEPMARRADGPVVVADEEALPFAEGRFDLAISNLSLHWVNDLPGTLLQIRRILKPDGLFLAATLGGDTLAELRECLMAAEIDLRDGASPRVSPFLEIRDAGALMQRAGFALPVIDSDRITVTYDNALKLLADLRGMGETDAAMARTRGFTRKDLFLRMAEIYHDRHAGPDGRIAATFEVIWLHGWAPHETQQQPLRPGSAEVRLADALDVPESTVPDKARPN
ncbi:MAG: methyltransferase domain-containing protein [Alphaproteobacteria bacterium]